jgi:RHS repeat-associated protein
VFLNESLARYEPFGSYRTKPTATMNPGISDRGFTGHRQNNTGDYDLGLIYMNARYYVPEIGRFASADTIVPDPGNPQSSNRYSYVLNSPIKLADPTGHMHDTGAQFGGGSSNEILSYAPAPGCLYTLVAMPFAPTSLTDPRAAELKAILCTPASGCQSIPSVVSTFLASPAYDAGGNVVRSEGQKEIGQLLSAGATGIDMLSTTISVAGLSVQVAATGFFGPVGPDDALAFGTYPALLDPFENATSMLAAGAIAAGDFFTGASNISFSHREAQVGQDTLFLAATATIGNYTGQVPFAGAFLDTALNVAVNIYDIGRLTNRIPSVVEMRVDTSGIYIVFYP